VLLPITLAPMDGPTRIETVLECTELDAMARFLVDETEMRIESISPADDPREIVLVGPGIAVRLRRTGRDSAGHLLVRSEQHGGARRLVAPNGTVVEFVTASSDVEVPPGRPELSVVRAGESFGVGRAGMGYRDLLPGRWGGRFIASHIRIADGGEVADYVHFHRVRFQMIFCARGWVDVVYEDQGEPFRLEAGDCVLQPPGIRHRVLRSSPGLEVIEIGCPAVHDTLVEHDIDLPTPPGDPHRTFAGQRFVRHVAADAPRRPFVVPGLTLRDTGIARATRGLADVVVIEVAGGSAGGPAEGPGAVEGDGVHLTHDGEFGFWVVLGGSATLAVSYQQVRRSERLGVRDAVALPPAAAWSWSGWTPDFQILQVTLPAGSVRLG
jgi:mannose-6-phosphate isomerase-like protein (cupin superfamily)